MSQSQDRYVQQNPNPMPQRVIPKPPEVIEYICGDCGAKTAMKTSELIRCRECGHRVMYKPRTTRIVQFEAR
ncbi:DNA-directed RNA polymerase I, II, and III subunit RPABC4 [Kwoniella heveanensis CBS 569]|nr:DNA-directed RNA polymerase I, II, and III subunit RPABC4 [Kwoniella heveanensis CBS 569]